MREWSDIDADLWNMENAAKGHRQGGGAQAFTAHAVAMSDGEPHP
jgi:hypothetical protein